MVTIQSAKIQRSVPTVRGILHLKLKSHTVMRQQLSGSGNKFELAEVARLQLCISPTARERGYTSASISDPHVYCARHQQDRLRHVDIHIIP